MTTKTLVAALLLAATILAGCADGAKGGVPDSAAEGAPEVEATSTTGGIRGVVVDEAIRPVAAAKIEVTGATTKSAVSDEAGLFSLSGLDAGTYLVKISHALYAPAQQTVEVEAGVTEPKPMKVLLVRTVFQTPFIETVQFDGFIVCSANVPVGYSEECGEGIGLPVVGRVGRQNGNNVQFDFTVTEGVESSILEVVWRPTSDAGKSFYILTSTDWVCDPFCSGNSVISAIDSASPAYGRAERKDYEDNELEWGTQPVTMFHYASRKTSPTPSPATFGLLLNQAFTTYATHFYYVPAPEGWSFVAGDPDPFK